MSRYRCNACLTVYPALQADGTELSHVCAMQRHCQHCHQLTTTDPCSACKEQSAPTDVLELVFPPDGRDERLDVGHVVTFAGKLSMLEIATQRLAIAQAMATQGPTADLKTQLADLEPVDPKAPHTIRAEGKGRTLIEE